MARLNPYVDPGPWGFVFIGDLLVPGVVKTINGASKPEEWEIQKGTGSSGATSVWKGTKLAESIKIETWLLNADHVDAYNDLNDALRPALGSKPPSLSITNAAINFSKITRVSCRDVLPPEWVESGGYWKGSIDLVEFNPSKATNAGPADPAKPDDKQPTENDKAAAELQKLVDQASKL